MARRDFTSMLGNIEAKAAETPTEQAPAEAPAEPAKAETSKPKRTPTPEQEPAAPKAASGDLAGGVGYDKLEVKAARVHERQVTALADLTRRLNKQRAGEGHRITENTLIRLGIDLLLERSDDLTGTTEAELAASLKLS